MPRIFADLAVGVVAGVVATFLTLVVRRLWISVALPWYEERVYQDAHFEGLWSATESYDGGSKDEYTLEFNRKGHQVEGRLTCVGGADDGSVYELTGSFKNLVLTATYVSRDKHALDRGAWTLKLTENGKRFVGHGAYYCPEHDVIEASRVDAHRKIT
jgi:hypothetical protein